MDNLDQFVFTNKKDLKGELQKMTGTHQILVTPELAKEWLSINTINRPLREGLVQYYAKCMEKGEWCLNGEPIVFSSTGVLMDGQHRLSAVVLNNEPIEFDVRFGININHFKTLGGGVGRTLSDNLAISNVPNYVSTAAAIRIIMEVEKNNGNRFQTSQQLSKTTMVKWYQKNQDLAEYVRLSISWYNISDGILTTSEFAAFAWMMAKNDKKRACQFMDKLATGFAATTTSPIWHLRRSLLRAKADQKKTLKTKFKRALIIKAWNAYVVGKSMKRLTFNPDIENYPTFTTQKIPQMGQV